MDKKFTIGLIALLGVSLFFLGCDDSSDDSTPSAAEKAATDLAGSEDLNNKVEISGATVTLKENVDITEDIEVKEGVTLNVANKKLEVKTGKKLTVAGTVKVGSGGTLIAPALDTITGLPTEALGEIAFTGEGKAVLEKNAKGYYGATMFISDGSGGDYKWDADTPDSSTVTLTYRKTTLNGKVTAMKETGVAPGTEIVIDGASTLTINTDVTFAVAGTLTVEGALTFADGGTIVVAGQGSVDLPNTEFGEGTYTATGTIEIKALDAGDTITTGANDKTDKLTIGTMVLGEASTVTTAQVTYTLTKSASAKVALTTNTLTIPAGASVAASAKAGITLGSIAIGRAETTGNGHLDLAAGSEIGTFTGDNYTSGVKIATAVGLADNDNTAAKDVVVGTNASGVLTVKDGGVKLYGANGDTGNATIAAGVALGNS